MSRLLSLVVLRRMLMNYEFCLGLDFPRVVLRPWDVVQVGARVQEARPPQGELPRGGAGDRGRVFRLTVPSHAAHDHALRVGSARSHVSGEAALATDAREGGGRGDAAHPALPIRLAEAAQLLFVQLRHLSALGFHSVIQRLVLFRTNDICEVSF